MSTRALEVGLSKKRVPPPASPTRTLFDEPALVLVDEGAIPMTIHKGLFTSISPFFRAAWDPTSHFVESKSGIIRLPEIPIDVFRFFVQWAYTRSLAHERLAPPKVIFSTLINLYKVADFLQVEDLRNAIIDEIASLNDKHGFYPTPDDTHSIFRNSRDGCPLRRLVVSLYAEQPTDLLVETQQDSW